jgi:hypothetical protein
LSGRDERILSSRDEYVLSGRDECVLSGGDDNSEDEWKEKRAKFLMDWKFNLF